MPTLGENCIICGKFNQKLRINCKSALRLPANFIESVGDCKLNVEIDKSDDNVPASGTWNDRVISKWELVSVECFRYLFGLPDSFGRLVSVLRLSELCNRCLQDVSNLQYIFWQLYSLEGKLVELQDLLFQRLENTYGGVCGGKMEMIVEEGEGIDSCHDDENLKYCEALVSLFQEIQSKREFWPGITAHTSRWTDALEKARKLFEKQVVPKGDSSSGQADAIHDDIEIKQEIEYFEELESKEEEDLEVGVTNVDESDDDSYSANYEFEVKRAKTKTPKGKEALNKKSDKSVHRINGKVANSVSFHGPSGKFQYLCTQDPEFCNRAYSSRKDLNKHVRQFHRGRTHICGYDGCVKKFLTDRSLTWHKNKDHSTKKEKKHSCKMDPEWCSMTYSTIAELKIHIKQVHADIMYKCSYDNCTAKFPSKAKLDWHRRRSHSEKQNESRICELCGMTFKSKAWKSHFRMKHLGKQSNFICERCSMDFQTCEELKTHETQHDQVSTTLPFTCVLPNCDKVLTNSRDLKGHVTSDHLSTWVKCEICGIPKANKYLLENHMRIHLEKNFACDECPKRFNALSKLRIHKVDYHLGGKYTCQFCGKEYSLQSSYYRHVKHHQLGKPFKCTICWKEFSDSMNLKKHEEIHSGVKKYKCEFCGKGFKQEQNLKQHLRTNQHKGDTGVKVQKTRSLANKLKNYDTDY